MISPAEPRHLNELIILNGVIQEIHAREYPGIFKFPIDENAVKNDFLAAIESNDHLVFVAEIDQDVVAYIWAQHIKRPESSLVYSASKIIIHHVCVAPDFRRSNIGCELMKRIENEADALNADHIALDVWSFNEGAVRFFEQSGYKPFNVNLWKRRES